MTDKFGRWSVVGDGNVRLVSGKRRRCVPCLCACGTRRDVVLSSLKAGQSLSCGCIGAEKAPLIGDRTRTHGRSRGDRLYRLWAGMRRRCLTPGDTTNFPKYGARGLGVEPEWAEFEAFKRWALANGYGETLQIDRIDNARGYFPDNCRWVTAKANQRNRTNNRIVEHGGRRGCIAEWAEWLGVGYGWLYGKVVTRGVPIAEIVRATAAA